MQFGRVPGGGESGQEPEHLSERARHSPRRQDGPAAALHPRTDVIKKDTSKQSSGVTACIKAPEILLTEKEVSLQVPYVRDSKMAKNYFTDV